MPIIRGLYMEDYPEQRVSYGQMLERAWAVNAPLSRLGELKLKSLDYADSPQEAIELLRQKGQEYTLFVADLLYHKDPSNHSSELVPTGLDAVLVAAKECPNIIIVAISVGEQESHYAGRIKEIFLQSGGHVYFSKDHLLHEMNREALFQEMGGQIEQAFRKKERLTSEVSGIDLDYDRTDPTLEAEFETIEESTFKRLIKQLAADCVDFRAAHVDPGISGASVFKLLGYNSKPFQGTARYLFVKVSRDHSSLLRELQGVPSVGVMSGVCPECLSDTPVEDDGWFAIGYAFLKDTTTLQAWLLEQRPTNAEIYGFLERLFGELRNMYASFGPEANNTALDVLFPLRVFGARALASSKELWPLVQRYVRNQAPDSQILKDFVRERKIGSRGPDSIPPGTVVCDCHGDLHGRNILVGLQDNHPYLVDFSERGRKHWASDFAQLVASLFVRGWDAGVESHECANLERWRQVFGYWLLSKPATASIDRKNAAIWSCLTWVRDNFEETMDGIHNYGVPFWELQLALAVEFIKLAGQFDVPSPKRAFALVAANDILTQLESGIPVRKGATL